MKDEYRKEYEAEMRHHLNGATEMIRRLRDSADGAQQASEEIDPEHYTPDDPNDIVAGLAFEATFHRELADLIEQQTAQIAEQALQIISGEAQRDELLARIKELESGI